MTDNLHCCFCGAELINDYEGCFCPNTKCPSSCLCGNKKMWQALIDGKKAQDKVIIAHTTIESLQRWLTKYQNLLRDISKILLVDTNKPSVLTVKGKQEIRRRITSITKQENE